MSTPSGKPFGPISPPESTPRKVNERTISGQRSTDDVDVASAYAPKRLRVVPATPSGAAADDMAEPPRFLMRDNKPSEPLAPASPAAVPTDKLSRSHETPVETAEDLRNPVDLDDLRHPLEPSRRPANELSSNGERTEKSLAQHTGAARSSSESKSSALGNSNDIERLEASLRWLKNQDIDLRHQQARKPLLAAEPRSIGTPAHHQSGDLKDATLRQPKPLEPESLLAPALRRAQRESLRGPRWVLIACVVAVPLAIAAVSLLTPASEPKREIKLASVEPQTPIPVPTLPRSTRPTEPKNNETVMAPAAVAPSAPSGPVSRSAPAVDEPPPMVVEKTVIAALPAPPPPTEPVVTAQPTPRAAQPTPPAPTLRQIDPAEIRILVRQGEQFIASGDIVTARVVFQRAAEAGDASAAMALGATYDPLMLSKLGALGVAADVTKARNWYQKAKDYGSQEAPRRLELLANR